MTKNSKELRIRIELNWVSEGVSVTKYNPRFRTNEGYLKDEWTTYDDIGKIFNGKKLTYSEYLIVETKYILAAILFLNHTKPDTHCFKIHNVEIIAKIYNDLDEHDRYLFSSLKEIVSGKTEISLRELPTVITLILRGYLWAIIQIPETEAYITFGYDYYMYFTNRHNKDFDAQFSTIISDLGLYIW